MKDIRNLLLDCRTALRKSDRHFEGTPLCETLDDTLVAMAQSQWSDQARAAAPAPVGVSVEQRVAYAWQGAARELRSTHSQIYEQLSKRVLQRLDDDPLDDPADEIETLQRNLHDCEARLQQANDDLTALCDVLTKAVPLPNAAGGNDAELAQQRLQTLVQALAQGDGLPKGATTAAPAQDTTPSRALLQKVVAGKHKLNDNEREWCIGEAMVLTGFERTPVQLLENGDTALAQLILDGVPAKQ